MTVASAMRLDPPDQPAVAPTMEHAARGPWSGALRRLLGDRSAVAGLVILAVIALAAILAPLVAPYNPAEHLAGAGLQNQPPSLAHPFGTDDFSRDVLSRVIHGARVSLAVSLLSVLIAATFGTVVGAVAGYAGGTVDAVLMRIVDALLAIPRVLLLVAVATLWGGLALPGLILLLGLTGWFGVSRLVRALVVSVKEDEFVTAARALGAGHARILLHHVLPHAVSPVLVSATLGVANVVVIEAGLTFLGMGVMPPQASWGNILDDGLDSLASSWWVSFFAGLALVTTVFAVNLVADGLREALDTRQLPAR
jgi:peptide/nickel transport system permease protein